MRSRFTPLLATVAAATTALGGTLPRVMDGVRRRTPRPARSPERDRARLAAAEAKRERRRAARIALAHTAPRGWVADPLS